MKKTLITASLLAIFSLVTQAADNVLASPAPPVAGAETETPATPRADRRLDGEWIFDNINGKKVDGEERPQLTIDLSAARFYGDNGCNAVNGTIALGANNMLSFSDIITTRSYCDNAPYEYLINSLLEKVTSYKISQHGNEYYLDLLNSRRQVVMVLRKHNMDFLDGLWGVKRIDGADNHNPDIELAIDIPALRVHCHTGCNIVNGSLFIDPDKKNSMQFIHLTATRMACPDSQTETSFLVALEEVESAFPIGDNEVKMVDTRGREVLYLTRLNIK